MRTLRSTCTDLLRLGIALSLAACVSGASFDGPAPPPTGDPQDHGLAYRGRVARDGRAFIAKADGFAFTFRGVSEFLLLRLLLDPDRDQAASEALVARRIDTRRRQGFSVLRVFGMIDREHAGTALRLHPLDDLARYQTAARRLLELARERGVYIEWVLLADNVLPKERRDEFIDFAAQLAQAHDNTFVEIADEGWRAGLDQAEILRLGRRFKERAPDVLLAGTSDKDGGGAYGQPPFDYVTIHGDRADGDDGWRWVLRLADGERVGAATERPVVQDQPMGSAAQPVPGQFDSTPERFRAAALLCHVTRQYFTFHHACALSLTTSPACDDVPTPGVDEIHRSDLISADPRDGRVIDGAAMGAPLAPGGGILRLFTKLLADKSGSVSYPLRVGQDARVTLQKGTTLTVLDATAGAVRSSRDLKDGEALALDPGSDVVIVSGVVPEPPPPPPPPEPVPAQQAAADVAVRGYTAAQATTIVHRLYQALLGRDADPGGLGAYQPLVAGGRLPRVASSLVTSMEFEGRRPGLNVPKLSADLYQAILGRAPDGGGDAVTQQAIRTGRAAQRAVDMVLSPEYEAGRL